MVVVDLNGIDGVDFKEIGGLVSDVRMGSWGGSSTVRLLNL